MKTKDILSLLAVAIVLTVSFSNCKKPDLAPKQPNIPNGGRAVAVAMHPTDDNKIVVASETGGLFHSTNGAANWKQVSDSATFRFRDVMYLPTNGNIVIAAANVDTRVVSGGGIYRSTDGGANWSKATINAPNSTCTNSMAAHCLSIDASNGRLWTGTDCGLFYSDDQGVTWSFLSGATGLGNKSIRAVLTPAANKMAVLTDNGIRVSINGGSSWDIKINGLPGNRAAGQHNQIAISPKNNQHIYFAFNFWEYNNSSEKWERKNGLYYTQDFGDYWSVIVKQNGWNRPPFVVLSKTSLGTGSNKIDLYFSNGGCQLRRREVVHGSIHGFNAWQNITIDHCDAADLGLNKDGKTPALLASDGGLHKTTDNGASWTMTGAGASGYHALQITEVTGQLTSDDNKPDLYFGTQDNDNWASSDFGVTWPNKRCCEGFYLNVPRNSLPASQTTHTGVSCAGCGNYNSGPALISQSGWNNPPRNNGNPALIKPAFYVQKQFNSDSSAWMLARSTNTGSSWTSVISLSENAMNLPLVVGTPTNPIIYLAAEKSGTTNGAPNIGLKRVSGFLGSTIVQSDLSGFGNIGTFPTMFAWYEVFGANPKNPNHIIVPDIANGLVRVSKDGGLNWANDNNLKELVTNSGEFKFHWDRFSQISCFGFDPECPGHIMVGTVQSGIFQTFNNGNSWEKVKHSGNIPFVSSFFFAKKGEVVISSYGRGLWRFRYECPPPYVIVRPEYRLREPVLWYKGHLTPIKKIDIPDSCPKCGFYLFKGGTINDVVLEAKTERVIEVIIDRGEFVGYNLEGEKLDIPFKISIGKGGDGIINSDKQLAEILKSKIAIKGIYLKGDLYNGILLHNNDLSQEDLPEKKTLMPTLHLVKGNDLGIPISDDGNIVVIGRGFDPQFPLEITMDGQRLELKEKIRFDDNGIFRLQIPPLFDLGHHTLYIRQKTEKGILEDMIDIRFTVQDFPDEK